MPTFPPECVKAVEKKGGVMCDWNTHCKPIQDSIDIYCKDAKELLGTPVPQKNPNPPPDLCYCCCSCFAYNTPIEVSPGDYAYIQDIQTKESILAGILESNQQLNWTPKEVSYSGGMGPNLDFDFMYYVSYQAEEGAQDPQFMITTVDHLFLMYNDKVKPVQYLEPGDQLRRSDGQLAKVLFVVVASYRGGVHHVSFPGFDNETLSGHLLSANSVVCADYSVQLAYSSGQLNPDLLDEIPESDGALAQVGDALYEAKNTNEAKVAFLSDENQWPTGLVPRPTEVMNIPATARSFLTPAQAQDVLENLDCLGYSNTTGLSSALWLFKIYGAFQNDVIFFADWENPLPNAYFWTSSNQKIILLTGGLLRLSKIGQEGQAFILNHLLASAEGYDCVGPADYRGVFFWLRQIWQGQLFIDMYNRGFEQITILFRGVSPQHARANPDDICLQPSLPCRLNTYEQAASMFPMPSCGEPSQYFALVGAKSGRRLQRFTALFNRELDLETAENVENYILLDSERNRLPIEDAQVDGTAVRLVAEGLTPETIYLLVVENVLSKEGLPLSDPDNRTTFKTKG